MSLASGCTGTSGSGKQAPPASAYPGATRNQPAGDNNATSDSRRTPANPPIDCPLRKQGINPHDLKPFADVQKYIDFLERSDRAVWQKPAAVVEELQLSGMEKIADVGAGSGYFTFRLARAVPQGMVYAIDTEPEMLRHIHHKAMSESAHNIEVIKSTADDPAVPSDADLVFVCNTLHHVKEKEVWLRNLSSRMKKGARLVVIEFREGDLPEGPPASLKISKNRIIDMIAASSFKLETEKPELLPYQIFLMFSKS
jgi:ubiquinone/menaquinone biosynthesis C-methylase UbiE